jgi:hypothetical protein
MRMGVVHGGRRGLVEEDGGAAGRPPRIGEVADLEAGDVGDRSGRRGRVGSLGGVPDSRDRGHGAAQHRGELTPFHERSCTCR